MKPLNLSKVMLSGRHVVEASAGTGKTFTLAALYLRLILERKLSPKQILVVTYTHAATAELRARIRERLRDAQSVVRGQRGIDDPVTEALLRPHMQGDAQKLAQLHLASALQSFDEASIFTIHGFCQRLLTEHAFESASDFEVSLVSDPTPVLERIVGDAWVRHLSNAPLRVVDYVRSKADPQAWVQLLKRFLSQSNVRLQPAVDSVNIDEPLKDWQSALETCAPLWQTHRDEIIDILLNNPGLNRNSYRTSSVRDSWIDQIDRAMRGELLPIARHFDAMRNLSSEVMATKIKKGHLAPKHGFFDACAALVNADEALHVALDQTLLAMQHTMLHETRAALQQHKKREAQRSFDDLLSDAGAALNNPALAMRLGKRYPVVLIDEFQDTDPVQVGIFKQICGADGSLFCIGDPKQAIYSFRGADVFAYMGATQDANTVRHTLNINWRSDASLLGAVNTLFARDNAFLFDAITPPKTQPAPNATDGFSGFGKPFQFLFVDEDRWLTKDESTRAVTDRVASDIVRLLTSDATLDKKSINPQDIAVLCRTNAQGDAMQDALRVLGVPSVMQNEYSVLGTPDADELQRILTAMAQPHNSNAIRSALCTRAIGLDAAQLESLLQDDERWSEWIERFRRWHTQWVDRGFVQAIQSLIDGLEVRQRLLRDFDGERRITNLFHLVELLHTAEAETHRGPLGMLDWLTRMRADAVGMARETAQLRLESDAQAVQIMTIHRSKGLEFPVVYCPFLWDDGGLKGQDRKWLRYHDEQGERVLDLGSNDKHAQELADKEARAESMRVLYVALTRAKNACLVAWGPFKGLGRAPLSDLLHPAIPRIEKNAPEHIYNFLQAWVERCPDSIGTRKLTAQPPPEYAPVQNTVAADLHHRCLERPISDGFRVSSFSQLTDVAYEAPATPVQPQAGPLALSEFPAGAKSGLALHDVLEHLDFSVPMSHAARRSVRSALSRFDLGARWETPILESMQAVTGTPLEPGLCLGDVRKSVREMEFTFPVAQPGSSIRSVDIARIMRRSQDATLQGAADSVEKLSFEPLQGFMRGYIDLVFEHEGSWYVADYKSNFLGTQAEHYSPERLGSEMQRHHYVLQYLLYTVAVDRFLRTRLNDYNYADNFGGVYYLFLRGMHPSHPHHTGVHFARPETELISAIDTLLHSGDGRAA